MDESCRVLWALERILDFTLGEVGATEGSEQTSDGIQPDLGVHRKSRRSEGWSDKQSSSMYTQRYFLSKQLDLASG